MGQTEIIPNKTIIFIPFSYSILVKSLRFEVVAALIKTLISNPE